jgi:hypothetical protein
MGTMHQILRWIDVGSYVFLGITFLSLLRLKSQLGNQRNTGLLARIAGGLALCLVGTSIVLPRVASPRSTVNGVVVGFHQVKEYRSSHFEFRVEGKNQLSGVLRANYFDKGFYLDDPAVSDGDTVEAAYLDWTNEVTGLTEVAGRHAGWTFQEDQKGVGPWLLIFGGALLVFTGIMGKISDIVAKPESDHIGVNGLG